MKAKLSKGMKALIIIGCIFACIFVAAMVYYFGASYPEFDKISTQAFAIPGLETKFTPQGLAYDETNNKFLVCGYMSDGAPSRIYIVDEEIGKTEKYITLLTAENSDYVGHAGGVTISYPYAYICGEGYIHRFDYEALLSTDNGESVQILDSYKTGNGADFVTVMEDKLVVGEFYRKENYPTPESHHITFGEETHYALSFVYQIDHTQEHGFNTEILYAISTPNLTQGMCLNKDGNIVLSTSYGLSNSTLYVYDNILSSGATTQVQLDEKNVDVYFLTKEDLIETYSLPCMSEEIVLAQGRVHVLFESKCKKYKLFTRTRMSHVCSLDI